MKQLKVLLILLAVFAVCYGFDFIKSKTVTIEVVSISAEPAEATPDKPVDIRVRLCSKNGDGIPDHNLYAITQSGGSFKSYRVKTDANGYATFTYYPYKLLSYQTLTDAIILIRDESNSVFIEVYPTLELTLDMIPPSESDSGDSGFSNDSIFD